MRIGIWMLAAALAVGSATAADLNGRKITVTYGDHTTLYAPVTLPCTDSAEGKIVATDDATARAYPASIRNGELVFVPEGGIAKAVQTYTLSVTPREEGTEPMVRVEKRGEEAALDVFIEDVLFTTYHYDKKWKKPFLWPLNSEGGVGVTRDFPMVAEGTAKFAQDHPHHKSFWSAYGEVNGVDCWAEGGGSGDQIVDEVTFGGGDAYGWIRSKNTWKDKEGKPLLTETREYRIYPGPEKARLFDAHVTFTADHGDAIFTDTKEGGVVAARMRPELSYTNAVITNAHGDVGEKTLWGKPSPWCDFSGDMKELGWRGLAIFDHPTNLRHPSSWHVRNYGLMGANCFGYSYFNEEEYNKGLIPENGDLTIAANTSVAFQYRMYVHSGDVTAAKVADRYADYATPPAAAWAE